MLLKVRQIEIINPERLQVFQNKYWNGYLP